VRALDQYRSGLGTAFEASGLLSLGADRRYRQGDLVLLEHPGAPEHVVALVTGGVVKVTASDPGTFLAIRGPGDLVGAAAAIRGNRPLPGYGPDRLIAVTALTDVTARVFPAERLRRFLREHPDVLYAVAAGLAERAAEAEARIISAACDSADRRLARLVCELERHGRPATGGTAAGTVLPVSLTHAELASWIGTCRETVDNALRRWRRRGIVTTRYRAIVVHDREQLAGIAGIETAAWTATSPQLLPRPPTRPVRVNARGHKLGALPETHQHRDRDRAGSAGATSTFCCREPSGLASQARRSP
jgi:CRP-like cAMP-binding protein